MISKKSKFIKLWPMRPSAKIDSLFNQDQISETKRQKSVSVLIYIIPNAKPPNE